MRRYYLFAIPLVISCCLYFATWSTTTDRAAPSLRKVFIGFRHGSRSPAATYANDIYSCDSKDIWPEGPNQLTKKGKLESYMLGEQLRKRYGDFLGQYYNEMEVRAYSTLSGRTMMSGQLVLASLFQPAGYQLWSDSLFWQPVPLYPEYIFNSSVGSGCPGFTSASSINYKKEIQKIHTRPDEVILEVMKYAGESNLAPIDVYGNVWDATYFQVKAGFLLPEWLKNIFPQKMTKFTLDFLTAHIFSSQIQRELILHNYAVAFKNFFNSDTGLKMEIHSWHDFNNMAVIKSLGIQKKIYPEPTSSVVLEIHYRNGQYFLEVYYYENYKTEPKQLWLPCGMSCTLEDMESIFEQYRPDNYTEICQEGNPNDEVFRPFKNLHL